MELISGLHCACKRGAERDGLCYEATERKEEDISNARKARGRRKEQCEGEHNHRSREEAAFLLRVLLYLSLSFVSSIGMCLALFHPIRGRTILIP